jgi:hypothetical protein
MNKHMHKVRQKIAPKQETLENGAVQPSTLAERFGNTHQDRATVKSAPRNTP